MQISANVHVFSDACNVYVLRNGRDAILIDFGSGDVLSHLAEFGVERVTDVLMTHHHRDQGQGLQRAVDAGARVWVPQAERDLFADVEAHWQARPLLNDYNNRQDRFSLLESVEIAGTLPDYGVRVFGGYSVTIVPTPGHTVGSVSFLVDVDDRLLAFTGDLLSGPGRVWSLAATQWSYNGGEGLAATVLSALDLAGRSPDVLLPSHGAPIDDPRAAVELLVERLTALLALRDQHRGLLDAREQPYEVVTPHLLRNLTSIAYSHVLLSRSGKALVIDYGYDFWVGDIGGADRASRRPWLYTLDALRRNHGVERIDVVIPTHYHDDHVAGMNLLRNVEGTQVWIPENMADVLARPSDHDLPCLWYDPIPADCVAPLDEAIRWEEYEITLRALPGHTLHAVAICFEVDGKRVVAVGDQFADAPWLNYLYSHRIPVGSSYVTHVPPPRQLNYVYRNRFRIGDYSATGRMLAELRPDLMLFGHWSPIAADPAYLADLVLRGETLDRLHAELLPLDEVDFGAGGFGASIRPYQATVRAGSGVDLDVEVANPYRRDDHVSVELVAPTGWDVAPRAARVPVEARGSARVRFTVTAPPGTRARRARVAADTTVGDRRFGQQAEALVTVV